MTSAVIAQRTHADHHTHTNVQIRLGHINTTVKRDPAQYTPQEVQAYLLHRVKDESLSSRCSLAGPAPTLPTSKDNGFDVRCFQTAIY